MHKIWSNTLRALPFILALSTPLAAQWPPTPTKGVPKTNGKPNLNAPAPRTADGKPDFSGLWEPILGPTPETAFPDGKIPKTPEGYPYAIFFDAAPGVKLPTQPWAEELMKKRQKANAADPPDGFCLPLGIFAFTTHPEPRRIVQASDRIIVFNEANYGRREIMMDGRPLPKVTDELQPWWMGYSIGRWEGDTLVVETTGLRDGGWLDFNQGTTLTSAAKLTERWRRLNFGKVQVDITVDDPKAYTKPWTSRIEHKIMLDTEIIEHVCVEGEYATTTPTGDVQLRRHWRRDLLK